MKITNQPVIVARLNQVLSMAAKLFTNVTQLHGSSDGCIIIMFPSDEMGRFWT